MKEMVKKTVVEVACVTICTTVQVVVSVVAGDIISNKLEAMRKEMYPTRKNIFGKEVPIKKVAKTSTKKWGR